MSYYTADQFWEIATKYHAEMVKIESETDMNSEDYLNRMKELAKKHGL